MRGAPHSVSVSGSERDLTEAALDHLPDGLQASGFSRVTRRGRGLRSQRPWPNLRPDHSASSVLPESRQGQIASPILR